MEYRITDDNGNRVIADLVKNGSEPLWMNVTVGLGHSPEALEAKVKAASVPGRELK
jgi:hypothetical protein